MSTKPGLSTVLEGISVSTKVAPPSIKQTMPPPSNPEISRKTSIASQETVDKNHKTINVIGAQIAVGALNSNNSNFPPILVANPSINTGRRHSEVASSEKLASSLYRAASTHNKGQHAPRHSVVGSMLSAQLSTFQDQFNKNSPGYQRSSPIIQKSPNEEMPYIEEEETAQVLQAAQSEIEKLKSTQSKLEFDLNEKKERLEALNQQYKLVVVVSDKFKSLYEAECARHAITKESLLTTEAHLQAKCQEMEEKTKEFQTTIEELKETHKQKMEELEAEKQKEIEIREKKLERLKAQMGEAFKGSSWERQQQLEELQKELVKVTDEADRLRVKLRRTLRDRCDKCIEKEQKSQSLLQGSSEKS